MSRTNASPWNSHFQDNKGTETATCKLCDGSGNAHVVRCVHHSTSSKSAHLQAHHRVQFLEITVTVEKLQKQLKLSESKSAKNKQPTLQLGAAVTREEKAKLKTLAAMVVCGDLRPLSFMDTDSWMSRFLSAASRGRVTSFQRASLMTECVRLEAYIKVAIFDLLTRMDSFSITSDGWSCGSKGFVTITAHIVDTSLSDWDTKTLCH
jgi:hypothetical protein